MLRCGILAKGTDGWGQDWLASVETERAAGTGMWDRDVPCLELRELTSSQAPRLHLTAPTLPCPACFE